jgi:hypothetical protein
MIMITTVATINNPLIAAAIVAAVDVGLIVISIVGDATLYVAFT